MYWCVWSVTVTITILVNGFLFSEDADLVRLLIFVVASADMLYSIPDVTL